MMFSVGAEQEKAILTYLSKKKIVQLVHTLYLCELYPVSKKIKIKTF